MFDKFRVKFAQLITKGVSPEYPIDSPSLLSVLDSANESKTRNKQVSWVYDCIDVYGKHFTKAVFRVYDKTTLDEVEEHPIAKILHSPNNYQTFWDMMYRTAQHISIFGNIFFYKNRNGLGLPEGLTQLIPKYVTPHQDNSTGLISHYTYNLGKREVILPSGDVIHIRYPDPESLLMGRPIIANILDQTDIDTFQTAYIRQFYKQGGFLGTTFGTDQVMNDASFKRTEELLKQKYGGGQVNAFKVTLLDSGLKPLPAPYSMGDMDLTGFRTMTRDEILASFQVNKFMLGLSENINRATAFEVSRQFIDGVIDPLLTLFDNVLTLSLAKEFSSDFVIMHDKLSPRDLEMNLKYYESGLKNNWLVPNEVRLMENFEALPLSEMDLPLNQAQKPDTTNNQDNEQSIN